MATGINHPESRFTFEQKEAAYRIGFQRGYASALGDLKILNKLGNDWSSALSRCLEFVRTTLADWRKNNLETEVPPPQIGK